MELSPRVRALLSLVVCLHIAAVFVAPFTFNSSPAPGMAAASPVGAVLMDWFEPYIDALYLRHGYAFFAPDPGPSHLFRAKLEFDDGREPEELMFPDLRRHRPRLLYHRHFMLSERLIVGYVPAVAPRELVDDPVRMAAWRASRDAYVDYYEQLRQSYIAHLKHRYGAQRVTLTRLEHQILSPADIVENRRDMADERLYEVHPEDVVAEKLP